MCSIKSFHQSTPPLAVGDRPHPRNRPPRPQDFAEIAIQNFLQPLQMHVVSASSQQQKAR